MRVVLKALPLPNDETPWEAIRDWRADTDAKNKFSRLRVWLDRSCRGQLTPTEIENEIAASIADYISYMDIQHKKFRRGALEVFSITSAELLEDILHLRPSKVVERLFAVSKQEVGLLEAELSAPGRELAYIAATRDRFKG